MLYSDVFEVRDVDAGGKKFDRGKIWIDCWMRLFDYEMAWMEWHEWTEEYIHIYQIENNVGDKNQLFRWCDPFPHSPPFIHSLTHLPCIQKVSRIMATSDTLDDMEMVLDVASEIYPIDIADKLQCLLVVQLVPSPSAAGIAAADAWRETASSNANAPGGGGAPNRRSNSASANLADEYDYVMHGRVYKLEDSKGTSATMTTRSTVLISYGGLLMSLSGPYRSLEKFNVGMEVYLLIRK